MTGIQNEVDILLTSETKLDETLLTRQLSIEGFTSPCRLDRNVFKGGLLAYVREDIPSKLIKQNSQIGRAFYRGKLKKQKIDHWKFLQPS